MLAQNDAATPPSADSAAPAQLTVEDLRKVFDRLVTASDGGDRKALASIRSASIEASYQQAYLRGELRCSGKQPQR